jgi:nucleotide-binding universal stress UspA family protein
MTAPVILLPVDGSEHAARATAYTLKMAGLMRARVLLLHCHRPFPVKLGEPYFQKAIDRIMVDSSALLEPLRSTLTENGVEVTDLIMEGPPADKICDVAQVESCEMIIMGSRGRSDLKGLLLGSVAHRVLQQAPCPVLVVR